MRQNGAPSLRDQTRALPGFLPFVQLSDFKNVPVSELGNATLLQARVCTSGDARRCTWPASREKWERADREMQCVRARDEESERSRKREHSMRGIERDDDAKRKRKLTISTSLHCNLEHIKPRCRKQFSSRCPQQRRASKQFRLFKL